MKETQIDEKDQLFSLKFGLSEKHTKFEKIFLVVLTNQLINLVNIKTMRKIFLNYVCFSKSLNFTGKKCEFCKDQRHEKLYLVRKLLLRFLLALFSRINVHYVY